MRFLADWTITHQGQQRTIQLFQGDLAALPPEHAVDLLVVSAFPNDYAPIPGTLIGALAAAGISIQQLSHQKHLDLRDEFSCWISHPIPGAPGFQRILCIESGLRGTPPEITDDIFRALAPASIADFSEASIAMPLIGTGNQGYPVSQITAAILTAANFWLRRGLKIRTLKIVVKSDTTAALALQTFQQVRTAFEAPPQSRHIDLDPFAFGPPQAPPARHIDLDIPTPPRVSAPPSPSVFRMRKSLAVPAPAPFPKLDRLPSPSRPSFLTSLLQTLTAPFRSATKPTAPPPVPVAQPSPPAPLDTSSMTRSGNLLISDDILRKALAQHPKSDEDLMALIAEYTAPKPLFPSPEPSTALGGVPHPPTPSAPPPPEPVSPHTCDIFLSYSHKDAAAAEALRDQILRTIPNARIFFDQQSLHTGGSWLMEIAESLDGARRVAALYTPNYWASKFCKDEFTAALLRQNDTGKQILFPIYFQDSNIPYFFRGLQHIDCREGDLAKLTEACNQLCHDLA